MEKDIEAFDCAASNPGINGHGQENECENSGVVPQGRTPPSRQAPGIEILFVLGRT
jgi:hypothetical protein